MSSGIQRVETKLFRGINSVVEPMVSRGFLSHSKTPAALLILETTGFKSGKQRRTPLWSINVAGYRIVSTARGDRSFWVKNLQKKPRIRQTLAGKTTASEAILLSPDFSNRDDWDVSPFLSGLLSVLGSYVKRGWAFAVLVPSV